MKNYQRLKENEHPNNRSQDLQKLVSYYLQNCPTMMEVWVYRTELIDLAKSEFNSLTDAELNVITSKLFDNLYTIVLTPPNIEMKNSYSFFRTDFRLINNLDKAIARINKSDASRNINYALDEIKTLLSDKDRSSEIDNYKSRLTVMTVSEVEKLLKGTQSDVKKNVFTKHSNKTSTKNSKLPPPPVKNFIEKYLPLIAEVEFYDKKGDKYSYPLPLKSFEKQLQDWKKLIKLMNTELKQDEAKETSRILIDTLGDNIPTEIVKYLKHNINIEEDIMNIYEQLNKIDDQESLSEKYNVKNAKELQKLKESSVSYKYTDQVWSVVSKDDPENAVFTGDKEECERFAKQQNLTPAARARDPRGGYYIVKQGADVPVITESSVSSRYTDDVWTVSFKNDPEHPIFKGDKDECDRFIKNNSLNAATKAHGGLVVKRGGSVPVITESSKKYNVKNLRELKNLKESLNESYITDKNDSLVKEIQEYIHDNIFGCEEIGFDEDHIYVVFQDDDSTELIDDCMDELYDAFDDLSFDVADETTLHIYVEQNTELNDARYESFVESRVDYLARAKDAEIWTDGGDIVYRWISQESSSEDDAFDVAKATNDYLVSLGRVGVKVSGTYWCRSYPDDTYEVSFITKKDLKYSDIEDATVYEYGIIDDSEYFEEEYTTDWDEALETFNNVAHRVQSRLVDMDDEEYEDYYSDGVVVRMITGKEGSDAWDWDTIREVTVFRDHIENEEALEESMNEKQNVRTLK